MMFKSMLSHVAYQYIRMGFEVGWARLASQRRQEHNKYLRLWPFNPLYLQ